MTVTHTHLWTVALLAFGAGDTATTAVGLALGAADVNPLVASHGVAGLLALKVAVLALAAGAYAAVGRPQNVGVPAGLATVGVGVTAWNAAVLAGVVG